MREEKDARRKKEAQRKEDQCQDRKFPLGGFGNCPAPLQGGEEKGRRIWGLSDLFQLILLEKTNSPQPGGEPQNSPRTSQNPWEGSFYTFLQPTPNPKISEYLEVLGWKSRFSCVKGRVCIPKIGWGNWGDTCEQEDDEGVQGEINIPEVRKMGGRGGSQEGGLGGWMPPNPCFGGAPVRRGWEEGQLFLTPYSMENTERGVFLSRKLLELPLPPPVLILG